MSDGDKPLPHLLIVDDDPDQLFLSKRMIEQAGIRCPIVTVAGGASAISHLARASIADDPRTALPAVVFLDLSMPFISGFEVLQWIRKNCAFDRMKIFVLSSSENPTDAKLAVELGAEGFLFKHPEPSAIGPLLRAILGVEAVGQQAGLRVEG